MKLKTGDKVIVISGANKGKEGKITKVLDEKVIVEGVNVCKKHLKPKNNNGTGEIVEVERPIHKSNVMLIDPKTNKPTRIKVELDKNGKKVRISKKSNEKID
ncbi:MAG: 50S ribosomal protein L24 [Bacilli bacterium]|nr:50S ribosomal protein L24 [Bacilli bacterium]